LSQEKEEEMEIITSRRHVIAGLGALGTGLALPALRTQAQTMGTAGAKPRRIDVHHHYGPPAWQELLKSKNLLAGPWRDWSPAMAIEDMDRAGVATSLLSITTPGVWFDDDQAARGMARSCNEYAAKMVADHRGRFGMFVVLPLPDIEGSLKEIAYGLDVLKADGVGLLTSYRDKWLGDPAFAPVYEELNRRKAVVYTHPTTANCCNGLLQEVPESAIEYGTDTTRAIAHMVFTGASRRYPDMRIIWSHAGGTMPFLIERFTRLATAKEFVTRLPEGFLPEARRFYYDTAQVANPAAMSALRQVIPVSQIVFGTDFPYRNCEEHVKGLQSCGVFNAKELHAIDRANAARLLPHYRA
jgi:6-methylsalicylate decarboxylase